jgi:hypothetical protein
MYIFFYGGVKDHSMMGMRVFTLVTKRRSVSIILLLLRDLMMIHGGVRVKLLASIGGLKVMKDLLLN